MALHPASVIRISVAAMWLFSPPILAVLAFRLGKRNERSIGWKAAWPLITAAAVLANRVLFIAFVLGGKIGGFGSQYMTTRLADVFLLVSVIVLVASILSHAGRWQLSLASTLMLVLWVGSEMVASSRKIAISLVDRLGFLGDGLISSVIRMVLFSPGHACSLHHSDFECLQYLRKF